MHCIRTPLHPRHPRRPSGASLARRGFTLIEMLVTMAIAGILLAVGVPAMTDFLAVRSSVSNADELLETLRFARSEALKRGSSVVVCATTEPENSDPSCGGAGDWMSGWVVKANDENGQILRVQNALRAMKEIDTGSSQIIFRATGITAAASFTFIPNGDEIEDRMRTVSVNPQGRAMMSKGKGA